MLSSAFPCNAQDRTLSRLGQLDQPLNKRNERAALRALSGVAAFTLSRFTTTTEQDEQALAAGVLPVPEQQQQQQQPSSSLQGAEAGAGTSAPSASVPLSEDMRLAIRFRLGKKRILSAAIERMGRLVQQLPKASVADTSTASRKGQAPTAATSKGFGKQGK